MKISIITVAYNAADTIADTLASVANQTHPDIEHIVIDGASTDDTLAIIRKNSQRVSKLISEQDKGIYDAMNKGLSLATGVIVGFLNADDVYADAMVLERVSAVIQNEKVDALFGDVEFFSASQPGVPLRRYRSARFRPELIAWGWMPAHPTLFLRHDIYKMLGAFKIDYKIAGDFELIARVFHDKELKYKYLPEVLVRMRVGGISTGGWRNTLQLNREVLRACRENGIKTNYFKIMSKYPAKVLEFFYK